MLVSVASSPSGPGIEYRFANTVAEGRAETFGVIVLTVVVKRVPNPSYLYDTGTSANTLGTPIGAVPVWQRRAAHSDEFVARRIREHVEVIRRTSIRDVRDRRLVAGGVIRDRSHSVKCRFQLQKIYPQLTFFC